MHPSDDPPASRQRWVSFDEARMILRMSEGTLRRAIREGKVTAEQRRRNPDSQTDLRMVYEVLVTDPTAPATPIESIQASPSATETPVPAVDVQALIEAATATATELLALERAERQRLANELRAESAARAAAETRASMLQDELDRERRPWWRKVLGLPPS